MISSTCIRNIRVPDKPMKIAGVCGYLNGSWREVGGNLLHFQSISILMHIKKKKEQKCQNDVFFI